MLGTSLGILDETSTARTEVLTAYDYHPDPRYKKNTCGGTHRIRVKIVRRDCIVAFIWSPS